MSKTVYPKGVMLFKARDNAPDFVKGQIIIGLNDFVAFCKDNPDYLSEYKGNKQLRLNLLDGNDGLYLTVDTWKPNSDTSAPEPSGVDDSGLPF